MELGTYVYCVPLIIKFGGELMSASVFESSKFSEHFDSLRWNGDDVLWNPMR